MKWIRVDAVSDHAEGDQLHAVAVHIRRRPTARPSQRWLVEVHEWWSVQVAGGGWANDDYRDFGVVGEEWRATVQLAIIEARRRKVDRGHFDRAVAQAMEQVVLKQAEEGS
jgi:hypothetical protein